MTTIHVELEKLVRDTRTTLAARIAERLQEIEDESVDHHLMYQILGVPADEFAHIDRYQTVGRLVYRHAGALLERATILCLQTAGEGSELKIPRTDNPKRHYSIDCYTARDNKAHEIKWRDATTAGDYVRKEHDKLDAVVAAGIIPVRLMFFMPNQPQAQRIQHKLLAKFREHGEAHVGDAAWQYVQDYSGVDLRKALDIAPLLD